MVPEATTSTVSQMVTTVVCLSLFMARKSAPLLAGRLIAREESHREKLGAPTRTIRLEAIRPGLSCKAARRE